MSGSDAFSFLSVVSFICGNDDNRLPSLCYFLLPVVSLISCNGDNGCLPEKQMKIRESSFPGLFFFFFNLIHSRL